MQSVQAIVDYEQAANRTLFTMLLLQVLYHRDIWMQHSNNWWGPLQRCWGVVEQAAGSQAAAKAKH
jgi:hypothetical protein